MFLYRRIFGTLWKFQNFGSPTRSIISSCYPDITVKKETIAEHLFPYFDKYANKTAFVNDVTKSSYTYSDLKSSIKSIASALTKDGLRQSSMVGIIASNSPEYLMLILAISSMGISVTICNQNFSENEITTQLMDSRPSILFTNEEYLEKVSKVAKQLSFVKELYLIGPRKSGYKSVEDLLNDSGNMNPIGSLKINPDTDVALMPYSSGTTGFPKGVMITHSNLVANFNQIISSHPISENKTMIIALPLYHIYATIIIPSMAIASGSSSVFLPKFEPIKFLTVIEEYKVSVLHLVPPQILFLLNHPDVKKFNLSSVERCFSAAAPLDALVEKRFIEKFRVHQPEFDIYQGYGLTETSPITHIMPNMKRQDGKEGSVGFLVPSMQCKIVDVETREKVHVNQSGELLLRGPNVMKGYFGKISETEKAFEDGWFKTGDIGHCDQDNYFYITDRIKELIKVKGLQVAPAELEATLLSIPGVQDCAVIGVPDERCGEVPRAFIVRKGDIQENEINEYMNRHLSPHKQLKGGIFFINEIPKSPSGKILRRMLKKS